MYSNFRLIFIGYVIFALAIDVYYLGYLSNGGEKTLSRSDYALAFLINFIMLLLAVFL